MQDDHCQNPDFEKIDPLDPYAEMQDYQPTILQLVMSIIFKETENFSFATFAFENAVNFKQ